MKTYSIVIPVYKNEDSIPALFSRLEELNEILRSKIQLQVIFVIDGSPDFSEKRIEEQLQNNLFEAIIVRHSRNFGAANAVRTGLSAATGEYVAVMAADLQEPLYVYELFIDELISDGCDVVIGRRVSRKDPKLTSLFASISWFLIRKLVNRNIPKGGVDIFACNRKVLVELLALQETSTSLIGNLFWLGFERKEVDYERQIRLNGKSTWTFRKKLNYLLDSIYSFTELPIFVVTFFGFLGVLLSLLASIFVAASRLLGYIDQAGYAPIVISIFMTTSANLLALGILGNYISRTYDNVKGRPNAIISSIQKFETRR